MTKGIGWLHPTDESDQWDGFNESGIEYFTGNRMNHLAREIVQNSLDAGLDKETVKVSFKLKKVETEKIPHKNELLKNIKTCLRASEKESYKADQFFKNAEKLLKQSSISVLEIIDSNTEGMRGPCKNGSPYYAFMKAKGQSKKPDETSSGSFGIGKFAPYAVSQLRTIFVSTAYKKDDGQIELLSQGKSILMSHDLSDERKQGIGFWGVKNKCQPIVGKSAELPDWINYSTESDGEYTGSKLLILGFSEPDKWQTHLAVSIAANFFGAIAEEKLNVNIDGKYQLTESSIDEFFENKEIIGVIKKKEFQNEFEQFNNCRHYLDAFNEPGHAQREESQTTHLGLCRLRILVGEGLPKKVCVLRKGMFIRDDLQGLKSFSDFKEFVAVFNCEDDNGNQLLRAMEPPRHDNFEPERLPAKDQKKGRAAIRRISGWVREMLKRHAKDPVSEVTEIDELRGFFGEEGDSETGNSQEEINPGGEVLIIARPIRQGPSPLPTQDQDTGDSTDGTGDGEEDGGGGADGAGGGDGQGGVGPGQGGRGGGRGASRSSVELLNTRAILVSKNKRKLFFTPSQSGKLRLVVKEAGAEGDYDFPISVTSAGELENGCLVIDAEDRKRHSVELEFSENFDKAIKVVAYEV